MASYYKTAEYPELVFCEFSKKFDSILFQAESYVVLTSAIVFQVAVLAGEFNKKFDAMWNPALTPYYWIPTILPHVKTLIKVKEPMLTPPPKIVRVLERFSGVTPNRIKKLLDI